MMRRSLPLFLFAALAATFAAEAAAPSRLDDDAEHLVLLGDRGPVLVRMHLRIDGKPHLARWNQLIDQLFRHADVNRDGILSPAEAKRLPPVGALASGPFFSVGNTVSKTPSATKMTRADVAAYYRKAGLSPFQISFQNNQSAFVYSNPSSGASPDQIAARLFALLDTNGDGVLSRSELEAAPVALGKLDADEDEMITSDELLGKGGKTSSDNELNFVAVGGSRPGSDVEKPIHLASGARDIHLAKRLLKTYGKKGALTLDAKSAGMSRQTFARLDTNHDGLLDASELAAFATLAQPDLEVTIRHSPATASPVMTAPPVSNPKSSIEKTTRDVTSALGKIFTPKKDPQQPISLHPTRNPLPAGLKATLGQVSGALNLRIELDRTVFNFSLVNTGSQSNFSVNFDAKSQYRTLFQMADTDGNGYLDSKEAAASVFFRGTFEAMDADGDGKLFEKEMLSYLDSMAKLQAACQQSCLTLTTKDTGETLFDRLDTNRDGRLSVRELRAAASVLLKLDADGDGSLSRKEIPRNYQATVERGPAGGGGNGVFFVGRSFVGQQVRNTNEKGPLWFRRMDRNRDGDISRKEWLGSEEDFRLIDTDNDGLINLAEAEAYDKTKRPKK